MKYETPEIKHQNDLKASLGSKIQRGSGRSSGRTDVIILVD